MNVSSSMAFRSSTRYRTLLFLPLILSGCASFQHVDDHWWGPDKVKHLAVAGAIGAASTALALNQDGSDGESLGIGVAIPIGIGAVKECYDQNVKGAYFSGKDMTWNAVGALVGSLLVIAAE